MTDSIELDTLVPEWLTLSETAERLGVSVSRVKQYLKEGELAAGPHGDRGKPHVPAAFLDGDHIVKGLSGTLTLLYDAGFSTEEAMRWLFSDHDALATTPAAALGQHRPKDVHRLAQLAGF